MCFYYTGSSQNSVHLSLATFYLKVGAVLTFDVEAMVSTIGLTPNFKKGNFFLAALRKLSLQNP